MYTTIFIQHIDVQNLLQSLFIDGVDKAISTLSNYKAREFKVAHSIITKFTPKLDRCPDSSDEEFKNIHIL